MSALREVTVADLIDQLSTLPQHYHVSPIVNGIVGVGIDTWLAYIEDVREVVVLFGEKPIGTPPTVPGEWLAEGGATDE